MIWFSCQKCGKALCRPESSAGAFIFCDCGQGSVVPWESTITAPSEPLPAQVVPPALPELRPVPVGEEKIPVARRSSPPPAQELPNIALPSRRDAANCFNHQDRPVLHKCPDCSEGFCADCLVTFKGQTLCGPCKNFRLRVTTQPATLCGKALVGVILGMSAAPLVMCLWPFGANSFVVLLCVMALVAQLGAVVLGALALRETEANPRLSGRSLAITSVLTGGLASLLTVFFVIFGPR
jgi:hypothetical protein